MADGYAPLRVTIVIGTRPELIKLAPVARAITRRGGRAHLLLTGQHPALDLAAAGLDRYAHTRLDLDLNGLEPPAAAEVIAQACAAALPATTPDWVLVQGDTTSALGGAIGAVRVGLRLAHVEAGLRTGDPAQPWPEESFRVQIDGLSDLLLAPPPTARDNLAAEGVAGTVLVTGNTGMDALRELRLITAVPDTKPKAPPLVLVTVHRRENLEAMGRIAEGLARAARECTYRAVLVTHLNPGTAARARAAFDGLSFVQLRAPQTPGELLCLMLRARVILSDSGGISEEAPTLGVPLLILREKTERPEAVAMGGARLVGSDPGRIARELTRLICEPTAHQAMAVPSDLFGDGHASERIADALLAWVPAARR